MLLNTILPRLVPAISAISGPLSLSKSAFTTSAVMSAKSTVFVKLGGAENVRAAVELFYKKIQADPLTSPFFKDIDMKKQKAKQIQFMALAFGGPNDYKGRSMYEAHKGMGLTDAHFDAVAGHFVSTLKELGVAQPVIDEAAAVVLSTRPQVLGQKEA